MSKIDPCFKKIFSHERIAYDTETTGLKYREDTVFGVSISTPDGEDYYWDIREQPEVVKALNDCFDTYKGVIICANAPFDYKMSQFSGIYLPLDQIEDVIIRAKLIDENLDEIYPWTRQRGSYSLDYLARKYLGRKKYDEIYPELAALFGGRATRNVQMPNLHRAPSELVAPYAKEDTRLTLELYDWQEHEIERQNLRKICSFERKLQPTLIRSEMNGIRVDVPKAKLAMEELSDLINDKQQELNQLVGKEINVNSPKQVKELFEFYQDEYGVWFVKSERGDVMLETAKSGNPSLDAPALLEIDSDLTHLITDVRSFTKTRDTFLGGFVVNGSVDGRIHANWNQLLRTGRLSIQSPSLQNIPARNKRAAKIVKSVFLPEEGHVWVDGDLASNEVRIFAHLVSMYDETLVEEYRKNPDLDLHQYVADLTGLPRNPPYGGAPNGKQLNLSAIFNQGRGHTAQLMGLPWTWAEFTAPDGTVVKYQRAGAEANQLINEYHRRVKGVSILAERAKLVAESRGYIMTKQGRHLRFPRKFKTYKASGLLIQATAGDINKALLMYIDKALARVGGRLLVNTHDSYSLSIPPNRLDVFKEIQEEVRNPTTWEATRVPLVLELTGVGNNWWEAISGDD